MKKKFLNTVLFACIMLIILAMFAVTNYNVLRLNDNNKIYAETIYNKTTELEERIKDLEKPYSDENWCVKKIKEWFQERDLNLESIATNYMISNNISSQYAFVYWHDYSSHRWNTMIEMFGNEFATCTVYDIVDWTDCEPTDFGMEVIKKHSSR